MEEEYNEIVKEAWQPANNQGRGGDHINSKLVKCSEFLSQWSKKFGSTYRMLREQTAKLEKLQQQEGPHNQVAIKGLKKEIALMLDKEDLKWRQRAKQTWLSKGDRNAAYFHKWANQRRKSNKINQILDEGGKEWRTKNEVGEAFVNFFSKVIHH